ncbi:DsbC family protein [Sansalvadorimonas verongulae]|uniref:DsbC family protein n=1 Tax=Sansalvadorimonas verongulae TaxID=2172824 RepID=UPI0018AD1A54|nr:DsbC family protein [Sansalvadorimonas verongulae]
MLVRKGLKALLVSALLITGITSTARADDKVEDAKLNTVKATIQAGLKQVNEGLVLESVEAAPVKGIYQIQMKSGELLYVSEDGQYIFGGDLMKIRQGGLDNLTEKVREQQVKKRFAAVDVKDMIVFSPKGERKGVLYVFTDVDCGYCRKLHQEVPELNAKGVEVRYLAFPRGGERAPAFAKMISAWCAKDRNSAMTTLKEGGSIPPATCENPVNDQYQLGISLGVRGTPAIYLEDGRSIPGYQPAPALLKLMGL